MFRDRGNFPSRIHCQMVGNVTGTRFSNSALSIRRECLRSRVLASSSSTAGANCVLILGGGFDFDFFIDALLLFEWRGSAKADGLTLVRANARTLPLYGGA